MCGIAGIHAYHYASNPLDREELIGIRDHMVPRGPDASGVWHSADGHAALASRRLSIIDLNERADQPFVSDDGRYALTYNGEIYNYKTLRAELEQAGVRFHTDSDTEVLLQMFIRHGVAMLPRLRGMFAFGLWDDLEKRLLLARDPYGIKPLYYADDGWTLRFASQMKALLTSKRVSRQIEPAGLAGFYLFGSVPEPYTLYQEIRSVPAGSYLWVDALGPGEPQQYFSIAKAWADSNLASPRYAGRGCAGGAGEGREAAGEGDRQEAIRSALLDSIRHHLVADVPVGAFLSAGVDSGAIVGLMRDAGQGDIRSVTLGFDEFKGTPEDETPLAEEAAARYGTRHQTRRVGREEFMGDLDRIFAAMDQPSTDGLNTWFVSKAAHEAGLKVALSGLGGDELFGGYSSFSEIPRWVRTLKAPSLIPGLGALFRVAASALGATAISPKLPGMLEYGSSYAGAYLLKRGLFMPWELPQLIGRELAHEGLRRLSLLPMIRETIAPDPATPYARVAAMEASLYMRNQLLRDTDWASMAHSLEVRVPLVDAHLLPQLAPALRRGHAQGKALLARSPKLPLPEAVVARAKTGFSTPIAEWLQQEASLDAWRKLPSLNQPSCPWARRWAYTVMARFGII